MFAVPGWSVSADALKTQVESKRPKEVENDGSGRANGGEKKLRKRKRGHSKDEEVTEENLDSLWRKHIEGLQPKITEAVVNVTDGGIQRQDTEKESKRGNIKDGNTEVINGDVSAGVSELAEKIDSSAQDTQTRKKKRKKRIEEAKKGDVAGEELPDGTANLLEDERSKNHTEDCNTKYEQRKARAAEKRKLKASQRADGSIPPTRPSPISNQPSEAHAAPISSKSGTANVSTGKTIPEATASHEAPRTSSTSKSATFTMTAAPPTSTPNLTPLQQRMAAKLTSARFRHLNQTLYTTPSTQALQLFTDTPQAYISYHAGFRAQVAIWPQNPVEVFIQDIKARGSVRVPSQKKLWRDEKSGKNKKGDGAIKEANAKEIDPLPRDRNGRCTIADLGCGDATLSSSLQSSAKQLILNILSFDLAKGDTSAANLITVADITKLGAAGVKNGSVDVAICCLSLMGTNWVDVVEEMKTAVRTGGEAWVAEIKSRFRRKDEVRKKNDGSGGPKGDKKKERKSKGGDEDDPVDLAEVEEEPLNPSRQQEDDTDVSAFVEVFRKRGFSLKGDADLTNKMFVLLRFVRDRKIDKGQENERGGAARFGDGFKGKQKRYVDPVVEDEADEGRVLKPCVYKTR